MLDISNSDFDVNILDGALENPTIPLTFPLPTDKDTYVELEGNEKLSKSFGFLNNFFHFFTGTKFDDIYKNNEYHYSINKYTPQFNKKMNDHMNEMLTTKDPKLNELVYSLIDQELKLNLIKAKDLPTRFKEVKEFMIKYYQLENSKTMPSFKSHNFLRVCYVTIMSIMRKMFPKGIWCNKTQMSELYAKYLKDPMSIIFFPNHQSHVDYIILHLVCVRFQFSTPTVIAGENLNVAIFGTFLRNLGAIFIKRSFNNELYTERNLTNLIEFILLNKINFEVFIEGTRSRDGKLLLPKYGILKYLCSIYLTQREVEKNKNFDMLFQPISITYERIYEADGYLDELLGSDKKQESMTNILKNGVSSLFSNPENDFKNFPSTKQHREGNYDNSTRKLNGKIFVKLGDSFTLSSFIEEDKDDEAHLVESMVEIPDSPVNLKKLGFKILHEINRVAYLPEIAIIGTALQAYHYLHGSTEFPINDLVSSMRLIIEVLKRQEELDNINTNVKLLEGLLKSSDDELATMIKDQVPQFFRFIKINFNKNTIKIENAVELLFYKNLTIHLVIHKSLVCFIISLLSQANPNIATDAYIRSLYYIFTGFLKNEFLFDYDYNKSNDLSNILSELVQCGTINRTSTHYEIVDHKHMSIFAEVVKPFIESYMICINAINIIDNQVKKKLTHITDEQLINDDLISKDFPTTKSLLRIIQSSKFQQKHMESINKQYLLSCLFYLDNLQLIRIFKNKAKTRAFVVTQRLKDLRFILRLLDSLLNNPTEEVLNDTNLFYMTDIIDKTFERTLKAKL